MSKVRLSKVMSERGMCSRREADQYIEEGVVRVDGEIVCELGTKIDPDAKITLDRENEKLLGFIIGFIGAYPCGN